MQSHKKADKLTRSIADKQRKRKAIETIYTAQISDFAEEEEELHKAVDMLGEAHYERIDNDGLQYLAKTICQTMLDIAELKERNRERRHQELMKFLEKHFSTAQDTTSEDDGPDLETEHVISSDIQDTPGTALKVEMQTEVDAKEEVNNSLGQELALEEVRLKLLPRTSIVEEQNDFQQMRRNMLELQRKKMEDRERKKRNIL